MNTGNKKLQIIIFAIGAMMILCRPFIAYQLTAERASTDPQNVYSILQRLISKKDERHNVTGAAEAEECFSGRLLSRQVVKLVHRFIDLFSVSSFGFAGIAQQLSAALRKPLKADRCLLFSVFLI